MAESWIIFDADNTLWNIEHLYDDSRNRLCVYLEGLGCDKEKVEEYQRKRDVELASTYGYSACRFARSFEDTVIHFLGGQDDHIVHCRSIALEVFDKAPKIHDNLEFVFKKLKTKFKLAILTAGERWVQEKRLSEFHLLELVDRVLIVEKKTVDVFLSFISESDIDQQSSWMVGDSLKSDIAPATRAGLNTAWLCSHNWNEYENDTTRIKSYSFKIHSLGEILNIVI